jgi:hypothetical protein
VRHRRGIKVRIGRARLVDIHAIAEGHGMQIAVGDHDPFGLPVVPEV